jgi:hypothetical protein
MFLLVGKTTTKQKIENKNQNIELPIFAELVTFQALT